MIKNVEPEYPAFIAHPRHGGDFHIVRPPQYDSMIHTQLHNPHRLLYDARRKIVRVRLLSFTTYAHPRYHYKAHTLWQFIK